MTQEWTRPWKDWTFLYFWLSFTERVSTCQMSFKSFVLKPYPIILYLGHYLCTARPMFQKGLIQSHEVKVGTSPLTSPKSILAVRSYLTCGGGRKRTNFRNRCPVCQETMTKLELRGNVQKVQKEWVLGSWTW